MSVFKSFAVALRGIGFVWKEERSFRIQSCVAAVVLICMMVFNLKPWENIVLVLSIASVLVLEVVNTVVEHFVDMVKPRLNSYVGVIKDMMAGAVLIMSIATAIIGVIIFVPHLIQLVIQ